MQTRTRLEAPRSEAPRLEAHSLAAFRGERLVLRDVSLTLAPGEALLLLGPNGSGKSTLLRLLAGLKRPDAGALLWDGEDALADLAAHGGRVAYLGHGDAIKPGLTVAENLAFAAAGRPVLPALAALGLEGLAELPARMLSAGQRRRLALARLPLSAAALWLLDEPTLGLDTASLDRLGAVLAAHRAAGGLVVAATHLDLPLPGARSLSLGGSAAPGGSEAPGGREAPGGSEAPGGGAEPDGGVAPGGSGALGGSVAASGSGALGGGVAPGSVAPGSVAPGSVAPGDSVALSGSRVLGGTRALGDGVAPDGSGTLGTGGAIG